MDPSSYIRSNTPNIKILGDHNSISEVNSIIIVKNQYLITDNYPSADNPYGFYNENINPSAYAKESLNSNRKIKTSQGFYNERQDTQRNEDFINYKIQQNLLKTRKGKTRTEVGSLKSSPIKPLGTLNQLKQLKVEIANMKQRLVIDEVKLSEKCNENSELKYTVKNLQEQLEIFKNQHQEKLINSGICKSCIIV